MMHLLIICVIVLVAIKAATGGYSTTRPMRQAGIGIAEIIAGLIILVLGIPILAIAFCLLYAVFQTALS